MQTPSQLQEDFPLLGLLLGFHVVLFLTGHKHLPLNISKVIFSLQNT